MVNSFSTIESLIIRQQLSKLSVEDIAQLIDKPIDLIRDKINGLTSNGSAIKSFSQLQIITERKKHNRAINNKPTQKEKPVKIYPEGAIIKRGPVKFNTKKTDYSEKVLVRLDAKTQVYLNPDDDIEEYKRKYHEKLNASRDFRVDKEKSTKEVKKFK